MWISSFIQRNGSDEARWSVNICGESSGVGDMWSAEERERTEVNCLWQNFKFVLYVGRSNIKRSLSVATTEWAWLGNDLVQWCCGEWGHSPHLQTLPSLQLVEFKISEREVPITIAQCIVIKFLTNENVGPNAIWRRLREQYGNQHYWRHKWYSGIKSFVEEEMPCKTQVINDTQGQASPQRISQRFVTLLKAIVGLLWLKFVRSLVRVSALRVCSTS